MLLLSGEKCRYLRCCTAFDLGQSVSDHVVTSPKQIDREGLGESWTGTWQISVQERAAQRQPWVYELMGSLDE